MVAARFRPPGNPGFAERVPQLQGKPGATVAPRRLDLRGRPSTVSDLIVVLIIALGWTRGVTLISDSGTGRLNTLASCPPNATREEMLKKLFFLIILVVGTLSTANASVVDFDTYTPLDDCYSSSVVSTGGLDFTYSGTGFMCVYDGSNPNGNGTPALILSLGTSDQASITRTDGGGFDLNSFEMAISWYSSAESTTVDVTAFFAAGGPSTQTLTLLPALQTYDLNLLDVSRVNVTGLASGDGYWVMDNVNVDIPEPASLALVGVGLIGVGLLVRRRRVR